MANDDTGLIARLFAQAVPEIAAGIIEIKAIARKSGYRTKLALHSDDPQVDCIAACVGFRVIFDFYFAETEGPETRERIIQSIALADQIQLEDGGICEEVQRGLASRSFHTGRFSVRRELAGYHFQQLLARYLRSV